MRKIITIAIAGILFSGCGKSEKQKTENLLKIQKPSAKINFPPPPEGRMEFTSKLLKFFPEKVEGSGGTLEGKLGWMDVDFDQISNIEIEGNNRLDSRVQIGFEVYDKNGDAFDLCYAEKSKLGDLLIGLKNGDKIRMLGQAMSVLRTGTDATFDAWFHVDSIQVIK